MKLSSYSRKDKGEALIAGTYRKKSDIGECNAAPFYLSVPSIILIW